MAIRRLKQLSESDKALVIEALKALFHAHEEVIFALIYGSMVDPVIPGRYGDIDIAVYVRPEKLQVSEYIIESQIEAEAYRVLSNRVQDFPPVEVCIINNAPYSFLIPLFKGKYLVLKEDEEIMTDFIEEVSGKALANSYLRSESLREVVEG